MNIHNLTKSLGLALALAVGLNTASAQLTGGFTDLKLGQGQIIELEKFNTSGGYTLQSITLNFDISSSALEAGVNNGDSVGHNYWTLSAVAALSANFGEWYTLNANLATDSFGTVENKLFAPANSATIWQDPSGTNKVQATITLLDPDSIAFFSNPNPAPLTFAVAVFGSTKPTAESDDSSGEFGPRARGTMTGTVSVEYLYSIPEPSTYALILGVATLGLVGFRRYRRRA